MKPLEQALEGLAGIQSVEFDSLELANYTIVHDPAQISEQEILDFISSKGDESGKAFEPSLGAAKGTPAPSQVDLAKLDMKVISTGAEVTLSEHLVPGKFTVFDYYADWCGPCLKLARKLEAHAVTRDDIAIRKIDIVNWESAAAKQATKTYKLPGLPYVRVYGPKGEFKGVVEGDDIEALKALLK